MLDPLFQLETLLDLLLSVVLGFFIGFERKMRYKEAGIRTHTIVCVGAALMMIVSKYAFGEGADMARVAAQIVAGVGFLGAGIIVYYAAKLHNEGASDEDVVKFVEEFREKSRCYFTVGDLEYLKRGGRLTSFKALMGTLLNLKPIIECVNGKLENIEKAKGRKKSIFMLIDYLERDEIDTSYPVTIINADSPEDEQIIYDTIT